jgi:hypothetical protein
MSTKIGDAMPSDIVGVPSETTGPPLAYGSSFSNIKKTFKHMRSSKMASDEGKQQPRQIQTPRQRKAFIRFFEILVFTAAFMILVLLHDDISNVHELENVMHRIQEVQFGNYGHTFNEVVNMVEVWQWAQNALLPSVIQNNDAV